VSYWFGNDNRLPQQRLAIVSYIIVGMIGVLLIGFWKLQVIDSDKFLQWAERNRVRSIPVIAPRGRMLDRDGRVLIDNYPSFSVLLLRDDPAQVEKSLSAISEGLDIPLSDLREQLQASRNLKNFQPIVIKPEASKADIAFIDSHRTDIPLLEMLMVHRRRYCRADSWRTRAGMWAKSASNRSKPATDGSGPATSSANQDSSANTMICCKALTVCGAWW